jgi:hypothetical protein
MSRSKKSSLQLCTIDLTRRKKISTPASEKIAELDLQLTNSGIFSTFGVLKIHSSALRQHEVEKPLEPAVCGPPTPVRSGHLLRSLAQIVLA